MELIDQLKYNPRNGIAAVMYFIFGSLLVWWTWDKIPAFTSIFDNTLPKALLWTCFFSMYAVWMVVIPYLCLSGQTISPQQFVETFIHGLLGAVMIVVALPIGSAIISAMSGLLTNSFLLSLSWFVLFVGVFFVSLYKPYEVLFA